MGDQANWGCGSAGAQRWALGEQCKAGSSREEVGESFQVGQEGLSDQGRHFCAPQSTHLITPLPRFGSCKLPR